ncbi:transposase [Pseudoroseomonas wenyumeiae]
MLHLPSRFAAVILSFAPLFFQRSWRHAEVLLIGAILAPGKRTVTSLLQISGLAQERRFVNYHRVLNRAVWSPRAASRLLLAHLITAFAPDAPVVLGIDDTIERRRGKRIAAIGIYRDPVRSSHGHFVKASGLRWVSLMLLAPVPWAGRVWALPFLSALAPSERFCRERGRRHKKLTDWARQLILQARRWLPERDIVLVGDNGFAALELLAALTRHRITGITRLRLDAALYAPAPPRLPGTNGRPRTKGRGGLTCRRC